jgi:hypothetical protein
MPKASKEQQDLFESTFTLALYRPVTKDRENRLVLIEVDDLPEPDSQGRRRAEGFKMVWEATVDPGEQPPCQMTTC